MGKEKKVELVLCDEIDSLKKINLGLLGACKKALKFMNFGVDVDKEINVDTAFLKQAIRKAEEKK